MRISAAANTRATRGGILAPASASACEGSEDMGLSDHPVRRIHGGYGAVCPARTTCLASVLKMMAPDDGVNAVAAYFVAARQTFQTYRRQKYGSNQPLFLAESARYSAPSSSRNAVGDTPVICLNQRLNEDASSKPAATATSCSVMPWSRSRPRTRSSR